MLYFIIRFPHFNIRQMIISFRQRLRFGRFIVCVCLVVFASRAYTSQTRHFVSSKSSLLFALFFVRNAILKAREHHLLNVFCRGSFGFFLVFGLVFLRFLQFLLLLPASGFLQALLAPLPRLQFFVGVGAVVLPLAAGFTQILQFVGYILETVATLRFDLVLAIRHQSGRHDQHDDDCRDDDVGEQERVLGRCG